MNLKKKLQILTLVLLLVCSSISCGYQEPESTSPKEWGDLIEKFKTVSTDEEYRELLLEQLPDETSFFTDEFLNEYLKYYSLSDFIDHIIILQNALKRYSEFPLDSERDQEYKEQIQTEVDDLTNLLLDSNEIETFSLNDFSYEPTEYYKEHPEKIPETYDGWEEDFAKLYSENIPEDSTSKHTYHESYNEDFEYDGKIMYYDNLMCVNVDISYTHMSWDEGRYEWENGVFYDEPGHYESSDSQLTVCLIYNNGEIIGGDYSPITDSFTYFCFEDRIYYVGTLGLSMILPLQNGKI